MFIGTHGPLLTKLGSGTFLCAEVTVTLSCGVKILLSVYMERQSSLIKRSFYHIQHSLSEYRLAEKVQKSFYCL